MEEEARLKSAPMWDLSLGHIPLPRPFSRRPGQVQVSRVPRGAVVSCGINE